MYPNFAQVESGDAQRPCNRLPVRLQSPLLASWLLWLFLMAFYRFGEDKKMPVPCKLCQANSEVEMRCAQPLAIFVEMPRCESGMQGKTYACETLVEVGRRSTRMDEAACCRQGRRWVIILWARDGGERDCEIARWPDSQIPRFTGFVENFDARRLLVWAW